MLVKELIEKLNKFNPDGNANVLSHFDDNDPDYLDEIYNLSMEEDIDGKLVVVIHTGER